MKQQNYKHHNKIDECRKQQQQKKSDKNHTEKFFFYVSLFNH